MKTILLFLLMFVSLSANATIESIAASYDDNQTCINVYGAGSSFAGLVNGNYSCYRPNGTVAAYPWGSKVWYCPANAGWQFNPTTYQCDRTVCATYQTRNGTGQCTDTVCASSGPTSCSGYNIVHTEHFYSGSSSTCVGSYDVRSCVANGLSACSDTGPTTCPQYEVLVSQQTTNPSSCNGSYTLRSCSPNGLPTCTDDGPTSCTWHQEIANTSFTNPSVCNGSALHRSCVASANTCSAGYLPDPNGPGCLPSGAACVATGSYTCPAGPNGPPACSKGYKPDPEGGPGCVANSGSGCVATPSMGCPDSKVSASSSCAWVKGIWTCVDSNTGIGQPGNTGSGMSTGTGVGTSGALVSTDQCGGINAPACSYVPTPGQECGGSYKDVNGVCKFLVSASAPDQTGPPSTHICTGANDSLCVPTIPLHDGTGNSGCIGGFHLSGDFCTANNSPGSPPSNAPSPVPLAPGESPATPSPAAKGTTTTNTTTSTTHTNNDGTTTTSTTGESKCEDCATETTQTKVLNAIGQQSTDSPYASKPYRFNEPSISLDSDVVSAKQELSSTMAAVRSDAAGMFSVNAVTGTLYCENVNLGVFGVHSLCLEPYRQQLAMFRPLLIASAWMLSIFIILG